MAEMLRDPDSTEKHLSIVRRHLRLCKLVKGAAFLRDAIEPAYQKLTGTLAEKKKATEAEEDAQDDTELRGREAADSIRTASERAKQYDRDVPGETVFQRIFPEGGFGDFIASNGTSSTSDVRLIATRIHDLGPAHALAKLSTDLEAHAVALEASQKAVEDAVRARNLAEAEDELAQAALRRAYEANSLDARKKFGKVIAERLFPRIRRRGAADDGSGGGSGPTGEGGGG